MFIFSQTPFVPKNNNSGSLASKLSTYRNFFAKNFKGKVYLLNDSGRDPEFTR